MAALEVQGSTVTSFEDRLVSVSEWVDGSNLDRSDLEQVSAAGALLADIHRALLDWSGPPHPHAASQRPVAEVLELRDPELDSWWEERRHNLVWGLCHGDYYRRNLLVDNGTIVGVIDWHEARRGPLIGEVAFAAWEFGHNHDMELVPEQFEVFLQSYRAGADHLPEDEYLSVPGAVRVTLRDNINLALAFGASVDDEYQQRRIMAFRHLARR